MRALVKIFAGTAAVAVLASAAPAAAQYYPGNPGYTYPGYTNPGYTNPGYNYPGYGNPGGGYGYNQQAIVNQCVAAVQARLNGGGYNGGGYDGGYGDRSPYAYGNPNGYGGARVLGISRVEPRSNGRLTVSGVATTGRSAGYGYTPNSPVDLTWKCKADYRGRISDIDVDRAERNYGSRYTPYNNDYSQYGYRRY